MAIRRPPQSRHDAIDLACGLLSYRVAADVTGLSESHLRLCSNPSEKRELSLKAAVSLDTALRSGKGQRGVREEPVINRWYNAAVQADDQEPSAERNVKNALSEVRIATLLVESKRLSLAEAAKLGRQINDLMSQCVALDKLIQDAFVEHAELEEGERQDAPSVRLVPRP